MSQSQIPIFPFWSPWSSFVFVMYWQWLLKGPQPVLYMYQFILFILRHNWFWFLFYVIFTNLLQVIWIENRKFQKEIFFAKNHSFSSWICIVHVLSFLLMYITLMYQKILNFDIFLHENFHFLPSYLTAGLAKTTAHRMLFLVSMDSQRSKKFDGSHIWALGYPLTASGWLKSIWAIMPPLSHPVK